MSRPKDTRKKQQKTTETQDQKTHVEMEYTSEIQRLVLSLTKLQMPSLVLVDVSLASLAPECKTKDTLDSVIGQSMRLVTILTMSLQLSLTFCEIATESIKST
ncbi:hypothetical protein SAMN05216388_102627 [Halorientalis persicus]|uniref:Uncharacterized protein n=1 Tax=Halorientalis persicus TaxID=1367881 RepID=A0A1H8UAC1_9EURY|nr:hypothetical protein SAMN05216388_102627 [Halorientalis persicus]